MSTLTKVRFAGKKDAEFFPVLNKRVGEYFKSKNISKHANAAMVAKTVFYFTTLTLSYLLIVFSDINPWIKLACAGVMGFSCAMIGMNVCHDAIHGGYSSKNWVNKIIGHTFNIVGANPYLWDIMHNQMHHTYTNIHDADEDVEAVPGVRTSPLVKRRWIHRFQHIYAFLFYGFASITWVFLKDYKKFFSKKIGLKDNRPHPVKEYFFLFGFKALYYVIFLVIPFVYMDLAWYWILMGFFISHYIEGATLALVFQLAHIVEGPEFPNPDGEGNVEDTWAVHQMKTTANFATASPLALFLTGGLNFQVEHHLFPKVCHIHYPQISKIVKATAKEYNVPYFEHKSFWAALASHIRVLKLFGRVDNVNPAIAEFRKTYKLPQAS
jgi:linoleoyl-CoA desaturase